jgi:hypothetical protein
VRPPQRDAEDMWTHVDVAVAAPRPTTLKRSSTSPPRRWSHKDGVPPDSPAAVATDAGSTLSGTSSRSAPNASGQRRRAKPQSDPGGWFNAVCVIADPQPSDCPGSADTDRETPEDRQPKEPPQARRAERNATPERAPPIRMEGTGLGGGASTMDRISARSSATHRSWGNDHRSGSPLQLTAVA